MCAAVSVIDKTEGGGTLSEYDMGLGTDLESNTASGSVLVN